MMLKYIELKTGYSDNGPAWIARVSESRSRRTLYFNGMALGRAHGGGIQGNYMGDGDEYWVSGVKKRGSDRRYSSRVISIEASAVDEYLGIVGEEKLDLKRFKVVDDLPAADISLSHARENMSLAPAEEDDEDTFDPS